jgi:protein-S-isoprenylcysteine O-methyltransferase Ste14
MMQYKQLTSFALVGIQFTCIGYLLIAAYPFHGNFSSLILIFGGAILAFWSIITMNKSKLRIFPEPSPKSTLITSGPYKIIRHPMYTAVLLCCAGLYLSNPNNVAAYVLILLFLDLILKLHWEESMLSEKFEEYKIYQQQSKKLIPFIY